MHNKISSPEKLIKEWTINSVELESNKDKVTRISNIMVKAKRNLFFYGHVHLAHGKIN